MKVSIKKLEDDVKQAERNLIKAEERLEIARKALNDAIKAPAIKEFNVFKKWEAWSKKTYYEDVCNVEGFYRPLKVGKLLEILFGKRRVGLFIKVENGIGLLN